jgi:small-conductance mechanosensitive channel
VLLGVGVAFAFLGASVQPLLVIAIIVAAITFLALRGISDNFAAGMILQTRQPIKVGDEIEIQNNVGIVRELNGRSVILETWDGRVVHVPNVKFLQEALYNHSDIGHRRSDLQVRAHVPPERVADVIDVITTTSLAVTGVLTEPSTRVFVIAVGPGEATLLVRFWHRPLEGLSERSASVLAIGTALTDANIEAVVTSDLPDAPFSPPFPV